MGFRTRCVLVAISCALVVGCRRDAASGGTNRGSGVVSGSSVGRAGGARVMAAVRLDAFGPGPEPDRSAGAARSDGGTGTGTDGTRSPGAVVMRPRRQAAEGGGEVVWPTHPITLPSGKVSIVPLGDSLTQGGRINGEVSYRYPLWKKLVDAGASFDMVGSETGGFNGDPSWPDYRGSPFDREHEGHWGITIDQVRDSLPGWLAGYRPDIALVLLGTNDGDHGDQVENMTLEAGQLFERLRAKNPHIIIVWGQPAEAWDPYPTFRSSMEMLVEEMTAETSPIILVDHSPGWVSDPHAPGTHTIDGEHTNPAGDEKLAANWMTVLRPLLRIN